MRLPKNERYLVQRQNRRRRLLDSAAHVAVTRGLVRMTRADIAAHAGVATGAINHAFGTMDDLRDALMQDAIETRNLVVLAQGVAVRQPVAMAAPDDLRAAALQTL